ncbi:MAG: hypothetical protein EOP48_09955 [Sphingobacteriales bacterium]|nr:MAG: hypothetical protein EOP48_09955 [Sphingobacteriales bacterium]
MANFLNGGERIEQNLNKESKDYGSWYYKKNTSYGSSNGEIVITPFEHYGGSKAKVGSGGLYNPLNPDNIDNATASVEQTIVNVKTDAKALWNSEAARAIIPDYFSMGFVKSGAAGTGLSHENTLTFILRGRDAGIYKSTTVSGVFTSGFGVDGGVTAAIGNYVGPVSKFTKGALSGQSYTGPAGVALKALAGGTLTRGIESSFDDKDNIATMGQGLPSQEDWCRYPGCNFW